MTTYFYMDNKRISKKELKEIIGEERLQEILEDATEAFYNDPEEQIEYFLGKGMLTVRFK